MSDVDDAPKHSRIDVDQNSVANLRLMKARQGLYLIAARWQLLQLAIVVAGPVLGAIVGVLVLEWRPLVGAIAVIITVVDVLVLDRRYRIAIKTAARGSEHFDVAVLQLPWNRLSAGAKLQPEVIAAAAELWSRGHDESEIRDWYPKIVSLAPLHVARVICQRANVSYDSALRRHYSRILMMVVLVIGCAIVAIGLIRSSSLAEIVISAMVPAAPLLIWAIREYFRQTDAAEANDTIQGESEVLLQRVIKGECDEPACTAQSMQFQSALFARRAVNPLLLPRLYKKRRPVLEKRMDEGAEHWIKEAGYWPKD